MCHSSPCLCRHLAWLSSHRLPSVYVSVSVSRPFFRDTIQIGFRAHSDNLGWSPPLKNFNLMISSKTLLPNQVTFTVPDIRTWAYLLGGHYSAYYTKQSSRGNMLVFQIVVCFCNLLENPNLHFSDSLQLVLRKGCQQCLDRLWKWRYSPDPHLPPCHPSHQ